ncbi:MAG: family 16 glycosylhydrolase, partial [Lentisphaerae bacterium]|nr:family 16 glycosylhydrolase [Lentisphaerota bacterium]
MKTVSIVLTILTCQLAAATATAGAKGLKPPESPVSDIPRLKGIVVDGKADDWREDGYRADVLIPLSGEVKPVEDCDGWVRLGWDERGLLLLARVHDDRWVESDSEEYLWQADGLEIYLAPGRGSPQLCQWVVAPGMAAGQGSPRWHFYDHRKDEQLKGHPAPLTVSRTRVDNGYVLEVLVPWSSIGIQPSMGREVAVQFWVNDSDSDRVKDPYHALWYPETGTFQHSTRMHRVRLSTRPSPPMDVRIMGSHDMTRLNTRFLATARADRAGTTVRLVRRSTGKAFADAQLTKDGSGYAVARIPVPLPTESDPYGHVAVRAGTRLVDECVLPDINEQRRDAIRHARIVLDPFVFHGKQFPRPDLERPVYMERLAGPCLFHTTYYDADYQEVTTAERPGRYGAVVEILHEGHEPRREFLTLYRTPEPIEWWKMEMTTEMEFPRQFGVPAEVARRRSDVVGDYMKWMMGHDIHRRAEGAVVLAGLSEASPDDDIVDRTSPRARDHRWWYGLKKKIGVATPYPYAVHVPDSAESDDAETFPAVLMLHGAGPGGRLQRFPDMYIGKNAAPGGLLQWFLDMYIGKHDLPMIAIVPVTPGGEWPFWSPHRLHDLIEEAMDRYPIDPDRFYLTGLSMGGMGSWSLAMQYPDLFAAVVPICGVRGDARDVARVRDIPVWVFHGDKDPSVPVQESHKMVAALRRIGGRVRYTEYPGVDHDSWTRTYEDKAFYDWLLKQKRGAPQQPRWEPLTAKEGSLPIEGYELAWSDEFNGDSLDLSKWFYRQDGVRRGQGVVAKETVSLDGKGHLVMTVRRHGSTVQLPEIATQGRFETTYGYFECRMKMQREVGHFPSFWLQTPTIGDPLGDPGKAGAEIDIFEYLRKDFDKVYHHVHWDGYGKNLKSIRGVPSIPGVGEGWHTFSLLWTEKEYVFYVDGNE